MSYKTRSGFLSARENRQRERRELQRKLAEEKSKREAAEREAAAAKLARKQAEAQLRERTDLERRVKRQEVFANTVEVAAQSAANRAVALREGRQKMARAAKIFAAIDARLNPLPEPE